MRALDTLSAVVSQQPDLTALAAAVRTAHEAVNHAARNVFHHAVEAGDALLQAKAEMRHGQWLPWLRQCDLSERQAQRYMAIVAAREALTANPTRVSDLSLRGLLALIKQPDARKPKLKAKPKKAASSFDALGWWSTASLEDRRHFFNGAGLDAVYEALPPAFWNRFYAKQQAQVSRLEVELRQRDDIIDGLQREIATLKDVPMGDGLDIPPSLQRAA